MSDVLSNLYPRHHSETKAVKHWNCYWREVLTQMFNTEVIRAHPYIWLWKGKTKRQYRSWHSAPSVTSIYRFVGFFEDTSSPENTNSWCFLDCLTISANIAHIIKTHFVVKSKTTLPFVYFKRTWKVYVLPLESLKTQLFWLWHWTIWRLQPFLMFSSHRFRAQIHCYRSCQSIKQSRKTPRDSWHYAWPFSGRGRWYPSPWCHPCRTPQHGGYAVRVSKNLLHSL